VKGTQNKLGWGTRRYIENCCPISDINGVLKLVNAMIR
jgi:hypothetical protein